MYDVEIRSGRVQVTEGSSGEVIAVFEPSDSGALPISARLEHEEVSIDWSDGTASTHAIASEAGEEGST
jgi:hypothetical protein